MTARDEAFRPKYLVNPPIPVVQREDASSIHAESPQSDGRATNRRLLGAFYTPDNLSMILTRWALEAGPGTVLDPSYGGCAFLRAAVHVLGDHHIRNPSKLVYGVDIDPNCVQFAEGLVPRTNYFTADFLRLSPESMPGAPFKAIVGNPPYVRHHWLKGTTWHAARSAAERAGISLRATASMWAYFVVHAIGFLAPEGRLAMLVPEAILQTDYAKAVRDFLRQRFANVILVYVRDRVFTGTDEPVVVVVAEGTGPGLLRIEAIDTAEDLEGLLDGRDADAFPQRSVISNGRVLSSDVLELVNELTHLNGVVPLGDLATIRIGFVTGANEFFIRSHADVDRLGIPSRALLPVLAKTQWLSGIDFTKEDHHNLGALGHRTFLVRPTDSLQKHPGIRAWIDDGTTNDVYRHYKCEIRNPWFRVKPGPRPDAFATCSRFGSPLLVLNRAGYRCSNAIHAVAWREPQRYKPAAIAVGYLTSLTAVLAEIHGRRYGGGVLKLEPSALRGLLVPVVNSAADAFDEINSLMRHGKEESARSAADEVVLRCSLGLSHKKVSWLERARRDLSRQRVPSRNGGRDA